MHIFITECSKSHLPEQAIYRSKGHLLEQKPPARAKATYWRVQKIWNALENLQSSGELHIFWRPLENLKKFGVLRRKTTSPE